jgi:hypothetical protein
MLHRARVASSQHKKPKKTHTHTGGQHTPHPFAPYISSADITERAKGHLLQLSANQCHKKTPHISKASSLKKATDSAAAAAVIAITARLHAKQKARDYKDEAGKKDQVMNMYKKNHLANASLNAFVANSSKKEMPYA